MEQDGLEHEREFNIEGAMRDRQRGKEERESKMRLGDRYSTCRKTCREIKKMKGGWEREKKRRKDQ